MFFVGKGALTVHGLIIMNILFVKDDSNKIYCRNIWRKEGVSCLEVEDNHKGIDNTTTLIIQNTTEYINIGYL